MAIVWKKHQSNTLYEVRSAGASVRLYTNKVFHSQYNPNNPISNTVWSLLLLPGFFKQADSIKRVLVLGVGGGAVIKLMETVFEADNILGIELNATYIDIAKKFFKLSNKKTRLIHADAIKWLHEYRGEPFDLIIDDLYGEHNGEPERAIDLNASWSKLLLLNLASSGVLVVNLTERKSLKQSALYSNKNLNKQYASCFTFSLPLYDNIIAAFTKDKVTVKTITENYNKLSCKQFKNALSKLDVSIKKIS